MAWPEVELSQILNAVTDGVAVVDTGFHVRRISQSYLDLLSLGEKEAVGQKCYNVLRGSLCHTPRCPLRQVIANCSGRGQKECPPLSMEVTKHLPGPADVPFILTIRPFYADSGKLVGIIQDLKNIEQLKTSQEELRKTIHQLQKTVRGTIEAIAATVETRDPYTAGHQLNVALIAREIGKKMNLTKTEIHDLWIAAMLHDIGKIYVPSEFLARPGHLTEMEFNILKQHPQMGYNILKHIEFSSPIAEIVLQHHERCNGSGYPNGLSHKEIRPEARIIAVADVVEAMSAHRPYRPAKGVGEATAEILKNRTILYDPDAADACLALIQAGKLPV